MTFDERFPDRGQHSWQTTRPGYSPNSAMTAQTCEQCLNLVEYSRRREHSDLHDREATT